VRVTGALEQLCRRAHKRPLLGKNPPRLYGIGYPANR
jgi:hypothetical protein